MMKRLGKKENLGITLIALVITIVVLIILAAVAINLSLGNNGIFNRAKTAKEQYQNAEAQEQVEVKKYVNGIDTLANYGSTREGLSETEIDAKIATAIQNATKEEILWENPNKNSAFAAQTVSWTTTEYNRVYVVYKNHKSDNVTVNVQTTILYPGRNSSLTFVWGSGSSVQVNRRTATFNNDNKSVSFSNGLSIATQNDEAIIPLYIIGFKSMINI